MITQRVKSIFGLFIINLSTLLQNRHCYICRQSSQTLVCHYCLEDCILPLFPSPGHNLLEHNAIYTNLCPPAYEGLYALGKYEGILQTLINRLKFSNQAIAAKVLAQFFERYIVRILEAKQRLPDALVPIPLSISRHISREYNQAALIAKELSNLSNIEYLDVLAKTTHTPQQSSLSREERLQNVKGVYRVKDKIKVNKIALIDDVVTTGSSCNEACSAILKAYPDVNIDIWCIAISMPHNTH